MSNEVFDRHYNTNFWGDDESRSGRGSNLKATAVIRKQIPILLEQLRVKSVLDIPCGDFYWFEKMWPDLDLVHYIGGDVVFDLITENRNRFVHRDIEFQQLNAVRDRLPYAELILCRDLLGHLPRHDVLFAIKNFKASGAKWLLATTFPEHENGGDIYLGEWRPINLASLFGLPNPVLLLNEGLKGEFADKSLGLWKLN